MKTLTILLSMFFVQQFFAQGENTANTTITVVLKNLKNDEGAVLGSLYSQKTFLRSVPEYSAKSKIVNGTATLVFEDVPAGTFGLTAFHDKNGNNQMDFEATGMPAEDYGISNNKFNPYGPPEWNDAKFEVSGSAMEMNIRLTR